MSNIETLIGEFKKYLLKQDMSSNTIINYISDINNFIIWYKDFYDSNIAAKEITFHHLNFYRDYIINAKRLKASSVNRKIQTLKRFFGFLVSKKIIKEDPSNKTKFLRRATLSQPSALSKSEVHALLSISARSAHGTSKRNYAIIQLILQTGLRIGEIINLQWQDVSLSERSGQIRVIDGKGHKERMIPLNSSIRKALLAYIEDREDLMPESALFLSKQNHVPTIRAIQKMIHNLATKANIVRIKVTPHTLRHTFATNYLRTNPGCLVELSMLLGHESLDTTAIYTKASKERLASTIEQSQFMREDL